VGALDHLNRSGKAAAIAAADHGDAQATGEEAGDKGDGGGGLARAADVQVADADDRHGGAVAGARHAAGGGGGVKRAQGGQQVGGEAGRIRGP
jgi:hypothetical protein